MGRESQQRIQLDTSAAPPLRWGWGSILDSFAFGNMSLSCLGSKSAPAVGTGNILWVFNGRQWGQVGHLSSFGEDLLHLAGLAQGLDENLMLLSPVVPSGWCILQKRKALRATGTTVSLHSQSCTQGPTWVTHPWIFPVDVKPSLRS